MIIPLDTPRLAFDGKEGISPPYELPWAPAWWPEGEKQQTCDVIWLIPIGLLPSFSVIGLAPNSKPRTLVDTKTS
jgi:hypothetical protein